MNKTELIIKLTVEYALDGEEPEVAHQMAIDSVESIADVIKCIEERIINR